MLDNCIGNTALKKTKSFLALHGMYKSIVISTGILYFHAILLSTRPAKCIHIYYICSKCLFLDT